MDPVVAHPVRRLLALVCLAMVTIGSPRGAEAQNAPAGPPAATLQQARDLRKSAPDQALALAESAAEAARKAGLAEVEADALSLMGDCHAAMGRSDRAVQAFRQALDRERALGRPRRIAEAHVRVSRTLMSLNQYEEAIQGYHEAIRLAETAGDADYAAVVTDHLGIAHFVLRNYDRAMVLCRQAEQVLQHSPNRSLYAQNLQHIGIIHTATERWADALGYFERVVELREHEGNPTELMGALSNVALALNGLKRHTQALATLNRALSMMASAENRSIEPLLRLRRARVYQALGRTVDAERDFEGALAGDRALRNKRRLAGTLTAAAGFYRTVPGLEQKAIEALNEALTLNEAVYNEDTTVRVQELQERFDAERRQKQIELLERDKALAQLEARRQRQVQWAIGVVAVLLVAGLGFAIVRYRVEARTSRELREALQNVQTLQGLLPICAHCKKIRNDDGYWQQVESYIIQHSGARFSHGICPDCMDSHYHDILHGAAVASKADHRQ